MSAAGGGSFACVWVVEASQQFGWKENDEVALFQHWKKKYLLGLRSIRTKVFWYDPCAFVLILSNAFGKHNSEC